MINIQNHAAILQINHSEIGDGHYDFQNDVYSRGKDQNSKEGNLIYAVKSLDYAKDVI